MTRIQLLGLKQGFVVLPITAAHQLPELRGLRPANRTVLGQLLFKGESGHVPEALGYLITLSLQPMVCEEPVEKTLAFDLVRFAVKADANGLAVQNMVLAAPAIRIGAQVDRIGDVTTAHRDVNMPVIPGFRHHRPQYLVAPARADLTLPDILCFEGRNPALHGIILPAAELLFQAGDLPVDPGIGTHLGIMALPVTVLLDHPEPHQVPVVVDLRVSEVTSIGIHTLYGIILQIIAHHVIFQRRRDRRPGFEERLLRVGDRAAQMGDLFLRRRDRECIIAGFLPLQTADIRIDVLHDILRIVGVARTVEEILTPFDPDHIVLLIQIGRQLAGGGLIQLRLDKALLLEITRIFSNGTLTVTGVVYILRDVHNSSYSRLRWLKSDCDKRICIAA